MEFTMYPEDQRETIKKQKLNMTLDFTGVDSNKISVLASPDVKRCKLTSPDVERFLLQSGLLATPTPSGVSSGLTPKSVTEEQEAYARGFVDALENLKQREESIQQLVTLGNPNISKGNSIYTTMSSLPLTLDFAAGRSGAIPTTVMLSGLYSNYNQEESSDYMAVDSNSSVNDLKEESQIVPCLSSSPVPHSPINLADQESKKLERKRERNRLAAAKCRNRKIERISLLENRVKKLKQENNTLGADAEKLKTEVMALKKKIMDHVKCGCQIVTPNCFK